MRNVASKHMQSEAEDQKILDSHRWGSLPALNLVEKEGMRSNEDGEEEQNGEDEGLQEVAGKLEIRVVPKEQINKENVPRPQTISPPKALMQNGHSEATITEKKVVEVQTKESPQRPKMERTKSILKQSSKEKSDPIELASPKRESIHFVIESIEGVDRGINQAQEVGDIEKKTNEIDQGTQCNIQCSKKSIGTESRSVIEMNSAELIKTSDKQIGTDSVDKKKVETESSSTETDQKLSRGRSQQDSLERNRKKMNRKTSLNFEPVESLSRSNSQKVLCKPLEAVKNNLVDSKSDSSSSMNCKVNDKKDEEKGSMDRCVLNVDKAVIKERARCSPSVDLSTNPNVTFVSATSIPDLKEKRSIANGLSPGMDEQSEYFDATENPMIKDKRQEQDDEDSGVDNASQILRESSTSPAMEGSRLSKIPVAVSGQRLAKCMSWSGDLTPGLRRRRQGDKYVTDPSQLKLRFKRHSSSGLRVRGISSCLIDAPESSPESSEGPPPPPPTGEPPSESQVRCRRFRPVT